MAEKKKTYEELEERIRELKEKLNGGGNREYKSRLFAFIFGREENKQWTLSLYNAIHGTSYEDVSGITINTMGDVVYMGMKNDMSFLVSETVSIYRSMELYEQQSTSNPNMPVRKLMYAGRLYDKFIHGAGLNRYGKTLMPLPIPKLVTFYNGGDEQEDETELRLSDAFREEIRRGILRRYVEKGEHPDRAQVEAEVERLFQEADPDIEVRVRMVNINQGHSRELLTACRPLGEYAWFVAQVRKNLESAAGIGDAIDRAIDEMPEDFEIRGFITANRAEVKSMCLTEYNEAETMEMIREEGHKEGHKEGREEGKMEMVAELIREGILTVQTGAKRLHVTEEGLMEYLRRHAD